MSKKFIMHKNRRENRINWHQQEDCEISFNKLDFTNTFINFADAGFYYKNDSLMCCSCELVITRDWLNIHKPLIFHALANRECPFLLRKLGQERILDICVNYKRNFIKKKTFICGICETNFVDRFLDCGHLACKHCLDKISHCAICRGPIANKNGSAGAGYSPC